MRLRLAVAALGATIALTFGTAFTAGAAAQEYPGGTTPERVDASKADQTEVLGNDLTRSGAAGAEPAAVVPAANAVGAGAAENGALALTGSDLVGLAVLGAGLVGVGAVTIRRTRRTAAA